MARTPSRGRTRKAASPASPTPSPERPAGTLPPPPAVPLAGPTLGTILAAAPVQPLPNPFVRTPDWPLGELSPLPPTPNPFGGPPTGTLSSLARYGQHPLLTGRRLVLMAKDGTAEGLRMLSSKAGLRLHPVDAGAISAAANPAGGGLPAEEGLVYPELGVCIVNASPDQSTRLASLVSSEASLTSDEPERYLFPLGLATEFLHGYRAGVDKLVEELLRGSDPGRAAAAAAKQRFEDDASTGWGLKAIRADATRFSGAGIAVAVLDTGIDLQHPDFAGRIVAAESFIDASPQDVHGHGTHCAGVVCGPLRPTRLPRYGVAPDVLLHVGKVLGDDGVGTDGSILGGILWAVQKRCPIISMSLGAPVAVGQPRSQTFEQVGRRALDAGSVIFAAAGNDSRRPGFVAQVSHPANCRTFVAVAAVDQALTPAWFSNAGLEPDGGQVDIAGPGLDVYSAWPLPIAYKAESGTSMATPHVAGVAALLAESDPTLRGSDLLNRLSQKARRLPASSADVGVGLAQAP